MVLLLLASGLAISQIVTHRYGLSLTEHAAARAENITHSLALDATDKILINDLVALQKLLNDQMASEPAIGYIFVVQEGQVLTHTFDAGVPIDLISANTSHDTQRGNLQKIVSEDGERYIDYAWPIMNGEAGILRLGFSERPYRDQLSRLRLQMSLLTLGVLVLATLVMRQLIDRLTRPLVALTKTVAAIDEGHLNERVPIQGRAEVSRLANAFNALLERLQEHTRRLGESKRQLEEKHRELDRAHRQLRTSVKISQEIAAISDLQQICAFLIVSLKEIVACRLMGLLVLGDPGKRCFWVTEAAHTPREPQVAEAAGALLHPMNEMTFSSLKELEPLSLPSEFQSAKKVALFPMHHDQSLIGALAVGCHGECRCMAAELDVIRMVLLQSAGAIRRAMLQTEEIRDLRARLESVTEFSGIVGRSPQMQTVFRLIEDVAPTDATVLIQGESGTGKELVARAIHERSLRGERPFVVINCSAYPSTLLESELFGHEKGAFTGAVRRKIGRFEQADGGTVFLDEIGEIPPSSQIKLLRVLQSQKFERLGGESTIGVDVRILAATNRNLIEEVRAGRFREDLYYRLNVIPILLPPLRQRGNDIPILAQYFLKRLAAGQTKPVERFSSEAMRLLMAYTWPGNVRELENSVEHAVVLAKESQIELKDLPVSLAETPLTEANATLTITASEERLIREALEACNWNKAEAARQLGISRSTLYEKLKGYKITPPTMH
jgi:two-component system response regulator HydG